MFGSFYTVGDWMILGLKLQIYVILRTLRGGVVWGLFPAMLGTFRTVQRCLSERHTQVTIQEMITRESISEVKLMNQLGYLFGPVLVVLFINYEIARLLPDMWLLQAFLSVVMAFVASMWLSAIMLVNKYELPLGQTIYQSFLASVLGVVESIAIGLAMFLMMVTGVAIPPVSFFMGAAALSLPHVWFSRSALARFERVVYQYKSDHLTH